MERKVKHLEMIQVIINRMAGNSFLIKGWCVTIVSALLALSSKDANRRFVLIAYYPVVMFWLLDGYFLGQERLFRKLYDVTRATPEAGIDFSMDTSALKKGSDWFTAFFSSTLILFYGTMMVAVLLTYHILFGLF